MYNLKLNPTTWDLEFSDEGQLQLVDGAELVAQRLTYRLRTHVNEWLLDVTMGLDYRGNILIKAVDLGLVRAEILVLLQTCPGVQRVTQLDLDHDTAARHLDVTFAVLTDEGDTLIATAEGDDLLSVLGCLIFVPIAPLVI
jgi:hypothetical protein